MFNKPDEPNLVVYYNKQNREFDFQYNESLEGNDAVLEEDIALMGALMELKNNPSFYWSCYRKFRDSAIKSGRDTGYDMNN